MDIWKRLGPADFLDGVERSLKAGSSVIVRFPGRVETGFWQQLKGRLRGTLKCSVVRPEPSEDPFETLRREQVTEVSGDDSCAYIALCKCEVFRRRLIWLDELRRLSPYDWQRWKEFLARYAHASRAMREREWACDQTVFVASLELEGAHLEVRPEKDRDLTLKIYDWRGKVNEMDILVLAHDELYEQHKDFVMRDLLATTIAKVAIWDVEIARRLIDKDYKDILDPMKVLKLTADEKGWTEDTPIGWEFGTDSGDGIVHAARVAIDRPIEVQRRVWAAQLSVLWPLIDLRRHDFVRTNSKKIKERQKERMNLYGGDEVRKDVVDLQITDLVGLAFPPIFNEDRKKYVNNLNEVRCELAHNVRPLSVIRVLEILSRFGSLNELVCE